MMRGGDGRGREGKKREGWLVSYVFSRLFISFEKEKGGRGEISFLFLKRRSFVMGGGRGGGRNKDKR